MMSLSPAPAFLPTPPVGATTPRPLATPAPMQGCNTAACYWQTLPTQQLNSFIALPMAQVAGLPQADQLKLLTAQRLATEEVMKRGQGNYASLKALAQVVGSPAKASQPLAVQQAVTVNRQAALWALAWLNRQQVLASPQVMPLGLDVVASVLRHPQESVAVQVTAMQTARLWLLPTAKGAGEVQMAKGVKQLFTLGEQSPYLAVRLQAKAGLANLPLPAPTGLVQRQAWQA